MIWFGKTKRFLSLKSLKCQERTVFVQLTPFGLNDLITILNFRKKMSAQTIKKMGLRICNLSLVGQK